MKQSMGFGFSQVPPSWDDGETLRHMATEYGTGPDWWQDEDDTDLVFRERVCGLAHELPAQPGRRGLSFSEWMLSLLERYRPTGRV